MTELPTTETLLVADRTRAISTFIVSLPVGAMNDPPGKEGLCFLTGQMLLRGAGAFDHAAFTDEVDALGSSLGVGVGRERTTLSGDALTRHAEAFEGLVAAALSAPRFDAQELDKLKRQTIAELAQVQDSDASLAQRFFLKRLFAGHPYGRPVKGTEATIAAIGIEDVRAFFTAHFVRGGAIVAAAGDLDQARLDAFVARTLTALPARTPAPPPVPQITPAPGFDVTLVDKPERSQTQVYIGHTTLDGNHPDHLPMLVAQTIFGGTFTSRLTHEIREKRGWSYGAYSHLSTDRHLGTFTMRFYPALADTAPAIAVAHELFTALVADGVTDDEVAFALDYLANGHAFSIDTAERRLSELLSARLAHRPDDFVDTFVARIREVTPAQVNAALRRHLRPDALICSVVATAADFEAAIRAFAPVTSVQIVDYRAPAYP